jgi:hypothetical protein
MAVIQIPKGDCVPELLEGAKQLAAVGFKGSLRSNFEQQTQFAAQSWDAAELGTALALAKLGFGAGAGVIVKHARDTDALAVLEAFCAQPLPVFASWLESHPLPATAVPQLAAFEKSPVSNGWDHVPRHLLARLRTPEAIAHLRERCRDDGYFHNEGCAALIQASLGKGFAGSDEVLIEAMLRPDPQTGPGFANLRNMAFARLVELGSARAVDAFARAYALGLESSPRLVLVEERGVEKIGISSPVIRGLGWLSYREPVAGPGGGRAIASYDAATTARIWDACLAGDTGEAWRDAEDLLANRQVTPEVLEVLCRRSREAPGFNTAPRDGSVHTLLEIAFRDAGEPSEAARELLLFALEKGTPQLRSQLGELVLRSKAKTEIVLPIYKRMLGDSATAQTAVAGLARIGTKDVAALVKPLLTSEHESVRIVAVQTLARLLGREFVPDLIKALGDPSPTVAIQACIVAKQFADRATVPALLPLLRSPAPELADAAKAALDRIRFVEENEEFWKKLAKGSSLTAPSAAEALVQQAGKDQPKATRVAAIDSLGVLAVPETLPFLITLMQDADGEIAQHATAAIQRIHAAKK